MHDNYYYLFSLVDSQLTINVAESCQIIASSDVITAECTTGFQVIAQLSNASEVQKLYVNQSMDPHTPVTVGVERGGLYLVTVFAITQSRGILDSDVVYMSQIEVKSGIRSFTSLTD